MADTDRAARKEARQEQREANRASRDAERQLRQQEKEEAEFRASPVGQARTSYQRGDHLFQVSFDLQNVHAIVIAMSNARTIRGASDPSEVLNAIVAEGWNFYSLSTAFVHEGEESRDKFMKSGQQTAVRGRLVGTYVFTRRVQHAQHQL